MKSIEITPNMEKIPRSLELAIKLESSDDENFIRENLGELLESMRNDLKTHFTSLQTVYDAMEKEQCLARVEQLSRVLKTIEMDAELVIAPETESHYANAVIPVEHGFKIAFSEGQAPGPIRAVVGFGKTIIGFKTDNLVVKGVDFDENDFRGASERQYLCRHVEGKLTKKDILHIIIRIPRNLISQNYLSDEERAFDSKFIFRAFNIKN